MSSIQFLPMELIIEILLRVLSSSFIDFVNLRSSSKIFWEASKEDYIYEHASLGDFPIIPRWPRSNVATLFLDRCLECGNPESFFRLGFGMYNITFFSSIVILMVLYNVINYFNISFLQMYSFGKVDFDNSIDYLKKAADKSHTEALYVLGIVLLYHPDESKKEGGKQILINFKNSDSNKIKSLQYRLNLKAFISSLWKGNDYFFYKRPLFCKVEAHYICKGWNLYSRYMNTNCLDCPYDLEINGLF